MINTVSQFHNKNTTNFPSEPIDILFFTNNLSLTKKFKKLNNKNQRDQTHRP